MFKTFVYLYCPDILRISNPFARFTENIMGIF